MLQSEKSVSKPGSARIAPAVTAFAGSYKSQHNCFWRAQENPFEAKERIYDVFLAVCLGGLSSSTSDMSQRCRQAVHAPRHEENGVRLKKKNKKTFLLVQSLTVDTVLVPSFPLPNKFNPKYAKLSMVQLLSQL